MAQFQASPATAATVNMNHPLLGQMQVRNPWVRMYEKTSSLLSTTGWAKSQVPFFSHKKLAHVLSIFFFVLSRHLGLI